MSVTIHILYLIRQESWLLPPCFSRFSRPWHQSYVTTISSFELGLISADARSPVENFLHGRNMNIRNVLFMTYFCTLSPHTVEGRKHWCQGGLFSSVWKLSPTKYICHTPSDAQSVMCDVLPSMMALYGCFGEEEEVYEGSVWLWSVVKAGISQKCFMPKSAKFRYSAEMQPI